MGIELTKDLIEADVLYQQGIKEGKEEGLEEGLEKGREEGLEKGREEGLEKGIEQEKLETARKSIQAGLSNQTIQLITGLSLERIESLRKQG